MWTKENAQDLLRRFVQQPILGTELTFFEKLEQQIGPAGPDTKKLAAEMLWLLYLFPLDTRGNTKREHIKLVWEWSGEPLDMANPWLGDALDTGIGAANPVSATFFLSGRRVRVRTVDLSTDWREIHTSLCELVAHID